MKKTLLLFIIALIVVSCEDSTKDIQTKVINLKVNSNEWVENLDVDSLNRYYSCHFSMPEITPAVFNTGTVTTYIVLNNGAFQKVLPYVTHLQDKNGAFWTQTVDFDYNVGGLNVYFTASDFAPIPPSTMNFHVVLMW